MPKITARSLKVARRLGRDIATRDALAAIRALEPSVPLPSDLVLDAYYEQRARISRWFSRARRLSRAFSDNEQHQADAGSNPLTIRSVVEPPRASD